MNLLMFSYEHYVQPVKVEQVTYVRISESRFNFGISFVFPNCFRVMLHSFRFHYMIGLHFCMINVMNSMIHKEIVTCSMYIVVAYVSIH